ncbi:MAG: VanZ family protein [Planctomycetota bacterium]|jgi:VanZ family protein
MRSARRWTLWALVYMALIFAVSSVPDHREDTDSLIKWVRPELQNLAHIPAYALLTWLWWRALAFRGLPRRRAVLLAAGIAIAYGALDEFHQYFVEGRFASVTDAIMNALGAALVVAWAFLRTERK